MQYNDRKLDIWSRGEVSEYLIQILLKEGKIKECKNLKIEEGYHHAFHPKCTKQYASRIPASNVHIDRSAGSAPSSYSWPICPKNCPYYLKSEDFNRSLNSEIEESSHYKTIYEYYVNPSRIKELNNIDKMNHINFDLIRLIEMLEELNKCYLNKCFMAIAMLVRSILDHVYPIFDKKTFKEVANNYEGAKSFKDSMDHLEKSSRKIADGYLHIPIRKIESLPNITQVNFKNDLDVLLAEIIRILKN